MKKRRSLGKQLGLAAKLTLWVGAGAALLFTAVFGSAYVHASDQVQQQMLLSAESRQAQLAGKLVPLLDRRGDAAGTAEQAALRLALLSFGDPSALYGTDGTQAVTLLSPVCLYGADDTEQAARVAYDIGGFSTDDLRGLFSAMDTVPFAWQGNSPYFTVYGKRYADGYIEVNRAVSCIDGKTWYAQTPVPEEISARVFFQRNERSDAEWDAFLAARSYLAAYGLQLAGLAAPADAAQYLSPDFTALQAPLYTTSDTRRYTLASTCVLDRSAAAWDALAVPLALALVLAPLLLWLLYRDICRTVSDPLAGLTRQAARVARLEFDQFQPDTASGGEIGALGGALTDMASELQKRWDSERDLEDRRQQFVAAASHDLKTPLALIGGYAEAIAQDISPAENARYLASIEQEAARMNDLVREMLDYTRLDRMNALQDRKTLDLATLLRALLEEYAPLFADKRLSADLADGVRLRGDETLLRRAVGCLLENAAKYTAAGGRVTVRLRNGSTLLSVENEGTPLDADEQTRVFEMFYRSDKARGRTEGHGLGLPLAQKIFALHGLACRAENTETGVRFSVILQ